MEKENSKDKKLTKHLDKLVMGAIIGGAVLSVIGARKYAKYKEDQQSELPPESASKKPKKKGLLRRLLGL